MEDIWQQLSTWFNETRIGMGKYSLSPFRILAIIAIAMLTWWGSRALERAIQRTAQRRSTVPGEYSGVYAIARVLRYAIWFIGIVWIVSTLGIDLTSLALLGGAVGVGIGLGLQNIVSNFISGLILMAERSLKIGDFVDLQSGVRGTVMEIAMRFTRVSTNDSVDVLVPNSEFVTGRVTNWTLEEYTRRIRVPFSVAYGSDKEKVKAAALAAARRVPGVIEDESRRSDVWMTGFGDSALTFELLMWIGPTAIRSPGRVQSAAFWALDDELRAAGITIPFPQRDVHLIPPPAAGSAAAPDHSP